MLLPLFHVSTSMWLMDRDGSSGEWELEWDEVMGCDEMIGKWNRPHVTPRVFVVARNNYCSDIRWPTSLWVNINLWCWQRIVFAQVTPSMHPHMKFRNFCLHSLMIEWETFQLSFRFLQVAVIRKFFSVFIDTYKWQLNWLLFGWGRSSSLVQLGTETLHHPLAMHFECASWICHSYGHQSCCSEDSRGFFLKILWNAREM